MTDEVLLEQFRKPRPLLWRNAKSDEASTPPTLNSGSPKESRGHTGDEADGENPDSKNQAKKQRKKQRIEEKKLRKAQEKGNKDGKTNANANTTTL